MTVYCPECSMGGGLKIKMSLSMPKYREGVPKQHSLIQDHCPKIGTARDVKMTQFIRLTILWVYYVNYDIYKLEYFTM